MVINLQSLVKHGANIKIEVTAADLKMFGNGELAKAKKEFASKDEELAKFQIRIAKLEAEKAALKLKHESDITKLRYSYQKEIDTAIKCEELLHHFIPKRNALNISLHIWRKIGGEEYDNSKSFRWTNPIWRSFLNVKVTIYKLVYEIFEPQEQISKIQANILGIFFELAMGRPAQMHVGTGGVIQFLLFRGIIKTRKIIKQHLWKEKR